MTNTIEQINPPTEPGIYQMRWTHGPEDVHPWRTMMVEEVDGVLQAGPAYHMGFGWAAPKDEFRPIEHYTGAEWEVDQ